MSWLKWAGIAVFALAILIGTFAFYQSTVGNSKVEEEITENPQGERAGIVMLLTTSEGKTIPVNYLREGNTVFVGADGPWWREFPEVGAEVTMLIRGARLQGRAKVVLNNPTYTHEVFARLRPTAPAWLPDWLNGKLVVIELAQ